MKKRLIATSDDWKADGVYTLSNTMSVGVKVTNGGDTVEYAYFDIDNGMNNEPVEAEIKYGVRGEDNEVTYDFDEDAESEPYFVTTEGVTYWLGDFIRTNF